MTIAYPEVFHDLSALVGDNSITTEQWSEYCDKLTPKQFSKKQHFMQAGDDPSQYGIIRSGVFRMYYVRPDGKEFVKIFKTKFQVMGALAEISLKIPSRIFIEALTESDVLVGNIAHFELMCQKYPAWMNLARLIALNSYIDKEQREFELLQLSAMERYQNFQKQFADIADQIPNYHIAAYLGITPVALSRMLNN